MSRKNFNYSNPYRALGLYSAYGISKWSIEHGLMSVYVEPKSEEVLLDIRVFYRPKVLNVLDAKYPGRVINSFTKVTRTAEVKNIYELARAWTEEEYGIKMSYVPHLKAMFPTPVVEILDQLAEEAASYDILADTQITGTLGTNTTTPLVPARTKVGV